MKRLLILLLLTIIVTTSNAMNYSKYSRVKTIDDFEDGTILSAPDWWRFGVLETEVVKDQTTSSPKYLGNYVLQFRGSTSSWYLGGIGTYIPFNATRYNYVKLIVKGYGSSSGTLLIELFDDDNENGYIEQNESDSAHTLYDDKFIYTLKVDWSGWKVVEIPLSNFKDANPGIGDNVWNPNQRNGSGGLTQIQLLALANTREGFVEIDIDTFKFFIKYNLE